MAFLNGDLVREHDWVLVDLGHEMDPILGVVRMDCGSHVFVHVISSGRKVLDRAANRSLTLPTGLGPRGTVRVPAAKSVRGVFRSDYGIRRVIVDAATQSLELAPKRANHADHSTPQQHPREAAARS